MTVLKKMLLWVLPLIAIISVQQPLKAQKTTSLKIHTTDTVDVCKNDRRVIVIVSLGNVLKEDNLVYFDIELKYDPTKLKFDQILTSGTLSEQFGTEIPAQGIFSGVGYMRAFAGSFKDIPAVGNKPLIAFLGTSLVSCPDTTEVALSYYDLQDYKVTVNDTLSANVIAREGMSNNRFVSLAASKDTVALSDTVTRQEVEFSLKGTQGIRFNEGILKVEYNSSSFKVSQIESITPDIEIFKIDSGSTGVEVFFKTLDSNNLAERKIKIGIERISDTTETGFIKTFIKNINECSCVTLLKDTVVTIVKNEKQIINSIQELQQSLKEIIIKEESEQWEIDGEGEWEAQLFSILGQSKGKFHKKEKPIVIEKNKLNAGIYLLVLKNRENHTQEIRILNK